MQNALSSLLRGCLLLATVGLLLTHCEKKPTTIGDKVDDALDARPNENLRDAGEELKDAAQDAKEEVQDAVK